MDSSFLDVRTHGYARVAVCVPRVAVGDPALNAEAHLKLLRDAHEAGAHYALCPELGLTGYSSGDLFFQQVLLEGALQALRRIAEETASWNMLVSVGLPLAVDGLLFNVAVTLYGGRALMAAPKSYPPNYREFYELRWFQPASSARSAEVILLGQPTPFGTGILARHPGVPGFVLHTDLCEDIWVPVPPGTIAALSGATVLANLSASNITTGKWEYRQDLVRGSSARNLAVQMYGAAGFGESSADLAWDGHGIVADRGEIVAETARFSLDGAMATADVDLLALEQDRMRQTSWGQNAADFATPVREVEVPALLERREPVTYHGLQRHIDPHPYVPSDPAKLDSRCHEIFQVMTTALARRLESLPVDMRKVVLGVSGGRDSALALIVAGRAMDLLGLPRRSVIGVTMPGFGTSETTYRISCELIRGLGASLREVDIRQISGEIFAAIGHDSAVEDLTFENVQAWARKFVLFSFASKERGIDLGTGDLSELALGWSTYGGDHMSHYAVNAGVPKTLVSHLIAWAAERVYGGEPAVAGALRDVLATPISPELRRPTAEGSISQLSEEVLGPYELHDFFLYAFTRFGFGPRRIARMALHAFGDRYTIGEIRRWLLLFIERFFASQFKRDCVPGSPKVGSGGSLSPRGDWRMPPDASPTAWLEEASSVPEVLA
ncbi:MAG: NAD(+) synthase [Dehalococcoidia bacterium]|nr:NAD(+) synthase [Dehalococcoidia bacterium]